MYAITFRVTLSKRCLKCCPRRWPSTTGWSAVWRCTYCKSSTALISHTKFEVSHLTTNLTSLIRHRDLTGNFNQNHPDGAFFKRDMILTRVPRFPLHSESVRCLKFANLDCSNDCPCLSSKPLGLNSDELDYEGLIWLKWKAMTHIHM